eukprot:COSAG02_NODE_13692_length_1361_cov_1.484152_1_plen_255_part_10
MRVSCVRVCRWDLFWRTSEAFDRGRASWHVAKVRRVEGEGERLLLHFVGRTAAAGGWYDEGRQQQCMRPLRPESTLGPYLQVRFSSPQISILDAPSIYMGYLSTLVQAPSPSPPHTPPSSSAALVAAAVGLLHCIHRASARCLVLLIAHMRPWLSPLSTNRRHHRRRHRCHRRRHRRRTAGNLQAVELDDGRVLPRRAPAHPPVRPGTTWQRCADAGTGRPRRFDTPRCAPIFFKQKTAYEIRIRDWSSDVCSSD